MGLFGCSHKWKKYGRKRDGIQQQKCTKCGRLRNRKVYQWACMPHQWRLDRRTRPPKVRCKKCGAEKEARQ